MTKVAHLIDDTALGGVNRLIENMINFIPGDIEQKIIPVKTVGGIPPRLNDFDTVMIHFTMSWAKLPALIMLRTAFRKRIVLVEHSYTRAFEERCVKSRLRFRTMLRLAWSMADTIVSVSAGQAAWIKEVGGREPVIIPCVPCLEPFHALPLPVNTGMPVKLGAFGRFHRQKGFDVLIEAMKGIPETAAVLDIAGYGEEKEDLAERARGLRNVHLMKTVNAAEFISEHSVILMPSRWEAGAVTCWETRASGRPVIVSDVDGLPEQVRYGSGIVVIPENVNYLREAIMAITLMDIEKMGRQGKEETQGAFEKSIENWAGVMRGQ